MKLYDRITKDNWIKHTYEHHRKGCLAYHLDKLYGNAGWELYGPRIRAAITLLYPERHLLLVGAWGIRGFNDHPDTTLEDVLRVCKVADV